MNVQQELNRQRKLTRWFIETDPTDIILIPHVRVKNSTGGWTATAGTPRSVQTFKLISLATSVRPTIVQDGVERVADYALLGEYGAVMAVGDTWIGTDGRKFEIIAIDDGHKYEAKALVVAHG